MIANQRIKQTLGVGGIGPAGVKRDAKMGPGLPAMRKPFRDALRGPIGGLVGMAFRAGIGRAYRQR